MRNQQPPGFTLVELMIATSLMIVVIGIFFAVLASFSTSASVQDSKISAADDARKAMLAMVRELRQARAESIEPVGGSFPASAIRYRIVADVDANGSVIDRDGRVEVTNLRTLGPDARDANRDGQRGTQLVRIEAGSDRVRVLASQLDPATGIEFNRISSGIEITVTSLKSTGPSEGSRQLRSTLTETVAPRN